MAQLLYGCGLRLNECGRLRVKDVDFGYLQIAVRDAKGQAYTPGTPRGSTESRPTKT
jgi:integrase